MENSEYKIIQEGKTGTGLLIENDGYVSLNETSHNKQIQEAFHASEWNVPSPFIVDAVFQKFGIKNANGRIYPEDILKREVEKYQAKIEERRAYGECYKPNAKILTIDGWKELQDVVEGEMVLTLNTTTNKTEVQPIKRIIKHHHNGEMIHIIGPNIDDVVTPHHSFPLYDVVTNAFAEDIEACQIDQVFTNERYFHLYIPTMNCTNGSFCRKGVMIIEKEYYEGEVMCVEVENHYWYVMCNGRAHWTHNCNHPADSTINRSRISHNIIELHWEGRTLVGKMELNTSEGFRKHGIVTTCGDEIANLLLNGYKIGVSSRGVGSVEQKLGQYIVGDDFELICFDVVSEPSTSGAYISSNKDNLQQYIETTEYHGPSVQENIHEKINALKRILQS